MEEIKSCPFCGSRAKLDSDMRWPDTAKRGIDAYFVYCTNYVCPIYHADNTWYKTPEQAIKAWNTRK